MISFRLRFGFGRTGATVIGLVLIGCAFNLSPAAADQIPALADVPAAIAVSHPELVSRRADLSQWRAALHGRFQEHNAECSSVVVGSSQDSACMSARSKLAKELDRHIADSKAFNSRVKSTIRDRIASLCSGINEQIGELRFINIKVVQVELDALGKLFEVDLGIYDQEEPPEDVLEEGREHLGKLVDMSHEVDELDGKKAWSEQQRKWILGHIFVATPTGGPYDVAVSNGTIHGQTDFSSLKALPSFEGCRNDSAGMPYIPQY